MDIGETTLREQIKGMGSSIHKHHETVKRTKFWEYTPIVAVCAGIALSAAAFVLIEKWGEQRVLTELEQRVDGHVMAIQQKIDADREVLQHVAALYATLGEVERDEFQRFTQRALKEHPGIQALEWIPRVAHSQRDAYEAAARESGFREFQIRERNSQGRLVAAAPRSEYLPVYFVEPLRGNESAVGFDLASNPARRTALERARDSGEAVASGRIKLVQERGEQFGFLIFVPIYRNDVVLDTVAQRREHLLGFALGVYRIGDMVVSALSGVLTSGFDIYLYDGSAKADDRFLYQHASQFREPPLAQASADQDLAGFHVARRLDLPGRTWQLVLRPTDINSLGLWGWAKWGGLAFGLSFSAMLAAYLFAVLSRTKEVERLVAVRTTDLQKAKEQLETEVRERGRAEQEARNHAAGIEVLQEITTSANKASSVEEAMQQCIARICQHMDWPLGHAYLLPHASAQELVPSKTWYLSDPEKFEPFREVTQSTYFAHGVGLPGRVLAGGRPAWIEDVTRDPNFPRAQQAASVGLRAGFAFPVLEEKSTVAVLEFFSTKAVALDERALQLVASIGTQLGRVTERKRSQVALQERAEALANSNAELEQFAYVASHDLQEPLRMVSSYLQLLERRYKGKLDADADKFIHYAVDGSARMKRLIEDLLQFSRVGSHGGELKSVDSEAVLDQALCDLGVAIEESGATVTHGPLPSVMADEGQLRTLLQNLIGNAIKYRGEHSPEVHVEALQDGRFWQFSVRDNGIGMDPAYHDRIFVIFQRLHGRDEYSGTGIGLAMCRKIIERHGGRIWVESEPGTGSTFHFTVSAAQAESPRARREEAA